MRAYSWRDVFVACLAFRCAGAVIVRTYFNPDEFWQSVEIAHAFVFGYGFVTWEWREFARIRGFTHPALFAVLFQALASLGIDTPRMIRIVPRLLQALFAAIGDAFLYKLAERSFGKDVAFWAVVSQTTNWFYFFCIVRTFSNSLETVLTIIALFYWPWSTHSMQSRRHCTVALSVAAFAVVIRPTSAALWAFLGIELFIRSKQRWMLIFGQVIPIAAVAIAASACIDRFYYGAWTLVPWNFIKFNMLNDGGRMYGTHPWHWYFTQGFPAILGAHLPLFILGIWTSRRLTLALIILIINLLMSLNAHKEFRFVLPALPLAFVYAGHFLATLHHRYTSGKKYGALFPYTLFVLITSNVVAAAYLAGWHQRAPVAIMEHISDRIELGTQRPPQMIESVHFLTGCHSTPFYSHTHSPIPMRMLDCSPLFEGGQLIGDRSHSESEQFLSSPGSFVDKFYKQTAIPSHIVVFDEHVPPLQPFLDRHHFIADSRFFYSHFDSSKYMILFERRIAASN